MNPINSQLEVIATATSTNGRYGVQVVGPKDISIHTPQEGKLVSLGKIDGHHTYQFNPVVGSGQWVLFGGDLSPVVGCTVVIQEDLQSSTSCTLIVGGNFFAVTSYGYKHRSSHNTCYHNGKEVVVSTAVMAAMGLIPCNQHEVVVDIPQFDSPLKAALLAAGLI
jgi:hypothetical protein